MNIHIWSIEVQMKAGPPATGRNASKNTRKFGVPLSQCEVANGSFASQPIANAYQDRRTDGTE